MKKGSIWKKSLLAETLLLTAVLMLAPVTARAEEKSWYDRVEVMAHRGGVKGVPENSIPAFEQAIGQGAHWIEMDVNQTKDGVPVVYHDEDLRRLTGKEAKIWEVNYQEIASLNPGFYMGPAYKDTRVPSLSESLDCCKGKVRVNIEIKDDGHQTEDFVEQVLRIISEKGMENQCMITSFSYKKLAKVKELNPEIRTGLITANPDTDLSRCPAADQFMISTGRADQATINQIHGMGKKAAVWLVNDYNSIIQCAEVGADQIITDRPGDILDLGRG